MKNTHKHLTATTILVSALSFNGCVINPGESPRGKYPYQPAQNGYYNPNNNGGYNNSASANSGAGAAGLQDLIGAKGASGEMGLQNRGYSYVKGEKGGGASFTAWRNGSQCVWVRTENGRYTSIADATPEDCR